MAYPKYKYHQKKSAALVNNIGEEIKLGLGWAESPSEAGHSISNIKQNLNLRIISFLLLVVAIKNKIKGSLR